MTDSFRKQLNLINEQLDLFRKEGKNLCEEEILRIEGLQRIIDFELTLNDEKNPFLQHQETILEWCRLNFNQRLEIENRKDLFAYIGQLLNMLIEEIESKVISKTFHELVLEELVCFKPDFVVTTDFDLNINYATQSIEDFLGYTNNELIKKSILFLFLKDSVHQTIKEHVKSEGSGFLGEQNTMIGNGLTFLVDKNGLEVYLQYSITYVEKHNIDGFIFSFRKNEFDPLQLIA